MYKHFTTLMEEWLSGLVFLRFAGADVREAQFLILHEAGTVKAWMKGDDGCVHSPGPPFGASTGQVEDLHHVKQQRRAGHH